MTATTKTAAALVLAAATPALAAPTFTALGFADGAGTYSHATSVSDDGRFVGGHSEGGAGLIPLIWDGTSANPLAVPDGFIGAYVNDISGDGTHAVAITLGPDGFRGIHWDASGIPTVMPTPSLPGASSAIVAINADGSVMSGFTEQVFFPSVESDAWTSQGGTQANHGDLAGGARDASLTGVTNDGTTFVGYADDGMRRAVRYTNAGGFEVLGTVAGGSGAGFAVNIGAQGGTIVGNLEFGGVETPAYWDTDGTAHLIGLPGSFDGGSANACSADGGIIVGAWYSGFADELSSTAFLWTAADGARPMIDVLTDDYGLDLDGWTLNVATDITPDGNTIVGVGLNPDGVLEAFKVTVPAPGVPALLGLGSLAAARRRR